MDVVARVRGVVGKGFCAYNRYASVGGYNAVFATAYHRLFLNIYKTVARAAIHGIALRHGYLLYIAAIVERARAYKLDRFGNMYFFKTVTIAESLFVYDFHACGNYDFLQPLAICKRPFAYAFYRRRDYHAFYAAIRHFVGAISYFGNVRGNDNIAVETVVRSERNYFAVLYQSAIIVSVHNLLPQINLRLYYTTY